MKAWKSTFNRAAGLASLCVAVCAGSALADTVTNIGFADITGGFDCCGYGNNWANAIQGNSIVTATQSGNTGTGVTFQGWGGPASSVGFLQAGSGTLTNISFSGIALTSNSTVQTLMNTFYGATSGTVAVVTFTSTDPTEPTVSFDVVGGATINDYYTNPSDFSNGLTGSADGVTASYWWTDANPTTDPGQLGTVHLVDQSFQLPAAWGGYDLTEVSIDVDTPAENPTMNSSTAVVLSAAQVDAATPVVSTTPEPSSWMLLGSGAFGFVGMVRRRMSRKA